MIETLKYLSRKPLEYDLHARPILAIERVLHAGMAQESKPFRKFYGFPLGWRTVTRVELTERGKQVLAMRR